jgi:hypothetical protein
METLKKTLFLIAFIILLTQTVRHAYYRWLEPTNSVLDKYGEPLKEKIKNAESINELLSKYDEVHKKVKVVEADSSISKIPRYERSEIEPFKSEQMLRNAIEEWEMRSTEIFKIRLYSSFGLLFVILGLFIYKRSNEWLGLALIITGFAEKIYWTSPSFFGSSTLEYTRLLNNKFYISLLAFIVLLIVAIMTNTILIKKKKSI